MANESKVQQQLLQLVAQSITEFLRFLKAQREVKLFEADFAAADEMLKLQMTIEDSPERYMAVTVYAGREDEFRAVMDELGIKYIYANASYLEKFTGTYLIDRDDFQRLIAHQNIRVHKEDPDLMEDEDELKREFQPEEDSEEKEEDSGEIVRDAAAGVAGAGIKSALEAEEVFGEEVAGETGAKVFEAGAAAVVGAEAVQAAAGGLSPEGFSDEFVFAGEEDTERTESGSEKEISTGLEEMKSSDSDKNHDPSTQEETPVSAESEVIVQEEPTGEEIPMAGAGVAPETDEFVSKEQDAWFTEERIGEGTTEVEPSFSSEAIESRETVEQEAEESAFTRENPAHWEDREASEISKETPVSAQPETMEYSDESSGFERTETDGYRPEEQEISEQPAGPNPMQETAASSPETDIWNFGEPESSLEESRISDHTPEAEISAEYHSGNLPQTEQVPESSAIAPETEDWDFAGQDSFIAETQDSSPAKESESFQQESAKEPASAQEDIGYTSPAVQAAENSVSSFDTDTTNLHGEKPDRFSENASEVSDREPVPESAGSQDYSDSSEENGYSAALVSPEEEAFLFSERGQETESDLQTVDHSYTEPVQKASDLSGYKQEPAEKNHAFPSGQEAVTGSIPVPEEHSYQEPDVSKANPGDSYSKTTETASLVPEGEAWDFAQAKAAPPHDVSAVHPVSAPRTESPTESPAYGYQVQSTPEEKSPVDFSRPESSVQPQTTDYHPEKASEPDTNQPAQEIPAAVFGSEPKEEPLIRPSSQMTDHQESTSGCSNEEAFYRAQNQNPNSLQRHDFDKQHGEKEEPYHAVQNQEYREDAPVHAQNPNVSSQQNYASMQPEPVNTIQSYHATQETGPVPQQGVTSDVFRKTPEEVQAAESRPMDPFAQNQRQNQPLNVNPVTGTVFVSPEMVGEEFSFASIQHSAETPFTGHREPEGQTNQPSRQSGESASLNPAYQRQDHVDTSSYSGSMPQNTVPVQSQGTQEKTGPAPSQGIDPASSFKHQEPAIGSSLISGLSPAFPEQGEEFSFPPAPKQDGSILTGSTEKPQDHSSFRQTNASRLNGSHNQGSTPVPESPFSQKQAENPFAMPSGISKGSVHPETSEFSFTPEPGMAGNVVSDQKKGAAVSHDNPAFSQKSPAAGALDTKRDESRPDSAQKNENPFAVKPQMDASRPNTQKQIPTGEKGNPLQSPIPGTSSGDPAFTGKQGFHTNNAIKTPSSQENLYAPTSKPDIAGAAKTAAGAAASLVQGAQKQETETDRTSGRKTAEGPASSFESGKDGSMAQRQTNPKTNSVPLTGERSDPVKKENPLTPNKDTDQKEKFNPEFSYKPDSASGKEKIVPDQDVPFSDAGMSFEDRIRSGLGADPHQVEIKGNQLGYASNLGEHDTFNKSVLRAFLSPAENDSMMAKGIRMATNRSMMIGLNAASGVMAEPLVQETIRRITDDLTDTELKVIKDIITRNNFGKFDLDDPALFQESLESYRKMLTKAGVLQSRDGGKTSMRIGKNVRKKGTKAERALLKRKAMLTGREKEFYSQSEKAIDFFMSEFAKSGKKLSKADAKTLVEKMFDHSGKVADAATLVYKAKMAVKNITSFGMLDFSFLNNTLFMQGLKGDPAGQGLYAAKGVISMSHMIPEGFMAGRQYFLMRDSLKTARDIAKIDNKLTSGKYLSERKRTSLMERRGKLDARKAKTAEKTKVWKARQEKFAAKKKQIGDTLRTPERKLKEAAGKGLKTAGKGIRKLPGGNQAAAAAKAIRQKLSWRAFLSNHQTFDKVLTTVIGKPLSWANQLNELFMKALLKVANFLVGYIALAFKLALDVFLILTPLIIIVGFTTTNSDESDAEEVFASTLGLAYESMQNMESTWVANIKNSAANGSDAYIDEFTYTRIDEATSTIDQNHRSEEASTYVPAVLGTTYEPGGIFSHGQIKGPEPWPDAPEEAYKWIGKIDGGVEVRFLGTGGYAGYTSNIMEISAMAAVAQIQSSLTEIDDSALEAVSSDSLFAQISGAVTMVISGIKNIISNIGKALSEALPGLDDFLTKTKENERARTFMAYCKPLFDQSHQMEFGLEMSLLPTNRTLFMDGAGNISTYSSIAGEGLSDTNYSSASALTTEEQEAMAKQIWDWMIEHGVSEVHAAGILGNMQGESDMNPGLHEAGKAWEYGGLGLCQWTGDRRKRFEAYMATRGTDWKTDWEGQLEFLFYGEDSYNLGILRTYLNTTYTQTQISQATYDFGHDWERFASTDTSMDSKRIPYALKYYELFHGSLPTSSTLNLSGAISGSSSTASSTTGSAITYEYKYSHTDNIDENGVANGVYDNNLETDDLVVIDGAESITVEVWASTQSTSYDWLYLQDDIGGTNLTGKIGGGSKYTYEDAAAYKHLIYTIEGNQVNFHFESNKSYGYYGYYASVRDARADEDEGEESSVTIGTTTYKRVTTKKYAHTDNINDYGTPDGTYDNNLDDTQTVTIDGSTTLSIEVWCAAGNTKQDYLTITDQDGTIIAEKLSGGNKTTKPANNSEYHYTYTVEGDTVNFRFVSNRSNTYYGYYAIVKGQTTVVETDEEAEANLAAEQGTINQVLANVQVCPDTDHNEYGCMSYDGFYYNDTERYYLYYPSMDGERIDVVEPAAIHDDDKWACNAPAGTQSQFYTALDHNPDCWDIEYIDGDTNEGEGYMETKGSTFLDSFVDDVDGYSASGNSHSFIVTIHYQHNYDHDNDDDECECTYKWVKYRFTHNCKGSHTGYYCGGHLKLIVYGIIYHISGAEREYAHDYYQDKTESIGEYYKNAEEPGVIRERIKKAEDLFDIDMGIIHVDKAVSDEFEGWTYDNMDSASTKLEDDWYDLYGIQTSYTIAGINGVSASSVLSAAEIAAHVKAVMDQITTADTKNLRLQALVRALTYVGQIGYDQACHGDPLVPGGLNDCSGYASQVWTKVLYEHIYTTDGFEELAKRYGAYHDYSDGGIQPGDILLHGMETTTRDDNHALVYFGVESGTVMSVDCSGDGTMFRSRGDSYYNGCTYVNMDVFIEAYLKEHPEDDEEPSILTTAGLTAITSGVSIDVANLTIPNLQLGYEGGLPIVYYAQGSGSPWAGVAFGGGTIATSGCSVTSLAMVLTYLTCGSDISDADAIITPDEVVATIAAHNGGNYNAFYVGNAGQSWDIFPNVASYYGVSCSQINSSSIIASLQAGKPVIMSCKPGIFTKSGHFIVLTGYDASTGLIYVNDPNGAHASYSGQGFSLATIQSQGKGWWSLSN